MQHTHKHKEKELSVFNCINEVIKLNLLLLC